MFFGSILARGLGLNSIMNYFTWDCRSNNEFIYDYINEKLQIVETIQEDSVQWQVHLRLHQRKTIISEKQYKNIQKCRAIYPKR